MKFKFILASFLSLALFTACDDEDDNPPVNPSPGSASVQLNYDFKYGSEPFALNQIYTTDSGYVIRYTLASFYLSKPMIMDDAGNAQALSPEYYIIRPDVSQSDLGTILPGHAHMFKVSIGIDEESNTEDGSSGVQPTDFTDANHPLAPQPEGMYWSWASGYIFVKIEGEVDYEGDGTFDQSFKYHLGTNEFRKDRSLMLHGDVANGETLSLTMSVDYKKFFEGIDLQSELISMSMGAARPLGIKMMDQFDAATTFSKN